MKSSVGRGGFAAGKVASVRKMPEYQKRLARELRGMQTESEAVLWVHLRGSRLNGAKFRRQRPLGRYIADFYCDAARLIVEVDGGIHGLQDQQEYDTIRDDLLSAWEYTVLRIKSEEVAADLPAVLAQITAALAAARFTANS